MTCPHCKQPAATHHGRTYITCGAPECQRKQRLIQQAKWREAHRPAKKPEKWNKCLGVGAPGCKGKVLDPYHICEVCKRYRRNYPVYSEVWGGTL